MDGHNYDNTYFKVTTTKILDVLFWESAKLYTPLVYIRAVN